MYMHILMRFDMTWMNSWSSTRAFIYALYTSRNIGSARTSEDVEFTDNHLFFLTLLSSLFLSTATSLYYTNILCYYSGHELKIGGLAIVSTKGSRMFFSFSHIYTFTTMLVYATLPHHLFNRIVCIAPSIYTFLFNVCIYNTGPITVPILYIFFFFCSFVSFRTLRFCLRWCTLYWNR